MAQKELEQLFKSKKEYTEFKAVIDKVLPIIQQHSDGVFSLFKSKMLEKEQARLAEIEKLEKQALCPHDTTTEEYEGSDSHKDYYVTTCKNCKAVIDTRSC